MGGTKFICSTKPAGFTLQIRNSVDSERSLLVGCRILLGTHSLERVPLYFTVFKRRLAVKVARQRWFDICLTRDEAIMADNFLSIEIGPSADTTRHVTVIDACVCYVKSKESLNYTQIEAQTLQKRFHEEGTGKNTNSSKLTKSEATQLNDSTKQIKNVKEPLSASEIHATDMLGQYKPKAFDCLLGQSLEVLEDCVVLLEDSGQVSGTVDLSISSDLLSLLCPPIITFKAKSLMYNILTYSSLKTNEPGAVNLLTSITPLYNNYTDDALLTLISATFNTSTLEHSLSLSPHFKTLSSYLDTLYDTETLERTLFICIGLIRQNRAQNLVKFLSEKFNRRACHFLTLLNDLFWRCVSTKADHKMSSLSLVVEALVEVMHTFLLVEITTRPESFSNSSTLKIVVEAYMKLLCNDLILDINFSTRRCLLNLLKPVTMSKLKNNPPPAPPQLTTNRDE